MASPYPFMWSLLTRTLDPDLGLLLRHRPGAEHPDLDRVCTRARRLGARRSRRSRRLLEERYDDVGTVCGKEVLLLEGNSRDVVPPEDC